MIMKTNKEISMKINIFDGLFDLIGRWKREVNMKNPYVFGDKKSIWTILGIFFKKLLT